MLQALAGFIPWILFWSCSGPGLWTLAILAGLGAALAIVTGRWLARRTVRTMEVATLAYFAVHALVTLGLGSPLLKTYGLIVNNLVLAAMAFGSLAWKSPFTYEYAREAWDEIYWGDPAFIRINVIITAAWGCIFTGCALLGVLARFVPGRPLLTLVLPNLGVAAGIVFSSRYPAYAARKGAQARLDAWDPHHWPAPSFGPRPGPEPCQEHDVIVVGSGIGGLSAAALLARRGLKVAVFEQHALPGGFCTAWERNPRPRGAAAGEPGSPYVFDAGVHDVSGLGERGGIRSLLRMLDLEQAIAWLPNDHEYHLNGHHIKVPRDADAFVRLLGERFPAEAAAIREFFALMLNIYREMFAQIDQTGGAPRPPGTVEELLAFPRICPHAYRWMDRPFTAMLDAHFRDPDLKALLGALTGFLTDAPQTLSVANMAPIFGYYFDGGYYPAGGSQALPTALAAAVARHQGEVHLRSAVRRILIDHGRAVGIELENGQIHRARAVIANADAHRAFLGLVGPEHLPAAFCSRIQSLKPSASAFHVFLGLDFVPDLASMTMLDGMAILNPSRLDPGLAPAGHAAVTLTRLLSREESDGWDRKAPDYRERKRAFADRMLADAEAILPGLTGHIVYRQEASPATFARYAWTTGGSIYGPAAGQGHLTLSTPIRDLYLAGSAVMGGGVEAAAIAGIHAANAILPRSLAT